MGRLVRHHAATAPRRDNRMDGINIADSTPAVIVVDFATVTNVVDEPPATSTKVESTPNGGRNTAIFSIVLGNNRAVRDPAMIGSNINDEIDLTTV
mmetsp:Transcript_34351/g.38626  ORF Transcript_34351/g.38626 Transcript_34351/m.38626 type:complete len:96 (+) Transcript_34351:136-423(+)